MRISFLVATAVTLGVCVVGCAAGGPLGWTYPGYTLTLRVVDESGAPVEGADVGASFPRMKTMNPFDGQTSVHERGQTNVKGECVLRGRGLPEVYVGAGKEGFYRSRRTVTFGPDPETKKDSDSVTVVLRLRKKIAPTAMYAKEVRAYLPVIAEPVGYDLLAGDWVAPHGKGSIGDFTVTGTLVYRKQDDFDATFILRFPNRGDGLAGVPGGQVMEESELRLQHEAPEDGYEVTELKWTYSQPRDQYVPKCSSTGKYWYLRLRTETDKEGRVVKAIYGKIAGPIRVSVSSPGPQLFIGLFTYYVNPDGTRNIEFDPKRNLVRHVSGLEIEASAP